MKKSPAAETRYREINDGSGVAVFDKDFCPKTTTANLAAELDKLIADGQTIKDDQYCYVSRIKWNQRDVVIKRYSYPGFFHSFRHTIKGSRAKRGWLNGRRLLSLNIDTPRPLAYIEQRKNGLLQKSYLITKYIQGQKLYHFLRDETITRQQQLVVTQQVMQTLEKLWNNHITHGDLKHTNILITEDGPVLTDLDGLIAHSWKPLFKHKRTKDINRFLKKTDIPDWFYHYCQSLIPNKTVLKDKQICDFHKIQKDDWAILISSVFPEDKIDAIIEIVSGENNNLKSEISQPLPLLQGNFKFLPIPSSDYARVFKCDISFNCRDNSFFLKQYLNRSSIDFIKHIFRPSRAKRSMFASLMLRSNGFDAPDVIGLFERRSGFLCTDSLLLTKDIGKALPMPQFFSNTCCDTNKDALSRKRAFIRAFAELIGQMHNKGIFHGDLRLNNVLVTNDNNGYQFFLIDNERTRRFYQLPARLRLKNLVQINMYYQGITNTDRLRFLQAYLDKNVTIQEQADKWIKKITSKTYSRSSKKGWFDTSLVK
jgi:tRNA A-37 threonylcarbamoyl transferase component Bud32